MCLYSIIHVHVVIISKAIQSWYVEPLYSVLDLAEEVWESFPTCYTAQKNEFILPLWRFHQKVGAKRLLNSL